MKPGVGGSERGRGQIVGAELQLAKISRGNRLAAEKNVGAKCLSLCTYTRVYIFWGGSRGCRATAVRRHVNLATLYMHAIPRWSPFDQSPAATVVIAIVCRRRRLG